jgi:hypothetical protein
MTWAAEEVHWKILTHQSVLVLQVWMALAAVD